MPFEAEPSPSPRARPLLVSGCSKRAMNRETRGLHTSPCDPIGPPSLTAMLCTQDLPTWLTPEHRRYGGIHLAVPLAKSNRQRGCADPHTPPP